MKKMTFVAENVLKEPIQIALIGLQVKPSIQTTFSVCVCINDERSVHSVSILPLAVRFQAGVSVSHKLSFREPIQTMSLFFGRQFDLWSFVSSDRQTDIAQILYRALEYILQTEGELVFVKEREKDLRVEFHFWTERCSCVIPQHIAKHYFDWED